MKYGQAILAKTKKISQRGVSDVQLAKALDIDLSTLYDWKKKYPLFSKVLLDSKRVADEHVVNALFKSAKGYKTTETHKVIKQSGTGKNSKAQTGEIKTIEKDIAPNISAGIFWLKNRQPDRWKDRKEELIALVSKDDLKKSSDEINAIIAGLGNKDKK